MMAIIRRIVLALLFSVVTVCAHAAPHDMAFMTVTAVASGGGGAGTGTLTLGSALTGYHTFAAAGVVSGETVSYSIKDGSNWEVGHGVYTTAGTTLTRGSVFSSAGGNVAIVATTNATVWITTLAEDMVATVYPSKVLAPIAEPPCTPTNSSGTITLALAACPTATNGVGYWQVTLTGNATLAITGAVVGSGFQLDIIEGSGPFSLTIPTGLFLPPSSLCTSNGIPTVSCTGPNQLVLSGVAQGKNAFYCRVASSTPTFTCGGVQVGLTQASTSIITNHTLGTVCANGTTCATTMTLTAGGTLYAGIGYCQASNCGTTGSNAVTALTGSGLSGCSVATGAKPGGAQAIWAEIWKCTSLPTGSTTVTATIGGSGGFYSNVMLVETSTLLTDDGKGAYATGTGTSSSVSTTGTTQSNEFIFAYTMLGANVPPITAGTGYTLIDDLGDGYADEWSGNNAAGANPTAFNFGSSGSWAAVVAAFHP